MRRYLLSHIGCEYECLRISPTPLSSFPGLTPLLYSTCFPFSSPIASILARSRLPQSDIVSSTVPLLNAELLILIPITLTIAVTVQFISVCRLSFLVYAESSSFFNIFDDDPIIDYVSYFSKFLNDNTFGSDGLLSGPTPINSSRVHPLSCRISSSLIRTM